MQSMIIYCHHNGEVVRGGEQCQILQSYLAGEVCTQDTILASWAPIKVLTKGGWGCSSAVECLISSHKSLVSTSDTEGKR